MPTVKDKITGKVISRQPYNQEGINNASTIAESNPSWEVSNAMERSEQMYAGGGITGYDVPMYKKGGKAKKKHKLFKKPYLERLGPQKSKQSAKKKNKKENIA